VKVSFGFIFLIVGILGIARGGVDSSQQSWGRMIGPGPGVASVVTLAAAFLLVGGLLILARIGRFSFEGSRYHPMTDRGKAAPPPGVADIPAADKTT